MKKVKIDRGVFRFSACEEVMYHEDCDNPKCKADELYYPESMASATCPQCRVRLPGRGLVKWLQDRVDYHLG